MISRIITRKITRVTREQTAQIDYVQPLKKLNIEGGIKGIFRSNFSNFGTNNLDSVTNTYVSNPQNTNNFKLRAEYLQRLQLVPIHARQLGL